MIPAWPLPAILSLISEQCNFGAHYSELGEVTDEPSLRREVRQSYQSVQLAIFWRAVVPTVWHACDYGGGPPLSIGELVLNCGEAANEALNRTRNDEVPNQQLERVEPGLAACRASSETKN